MKRKSFSLVVIMMLILLLSACGGIKVGNESDLATNIKQGAVLSIAEVYPTSANYQISNQTGETISTGNGNVISIEVKQNGKWHEIDIGEISHTAEALIIESGKTVDLQADWSRSYGKLPKGSYRLLKGFIGEVSGNSFVLSANFEIN